MWAGIDVHLLCCLPYFYLLLIVVQRNQFCLWGADQPWKEGTLWPLWRTRFARRRWVRPGDGRYLFPHFWWWTVWIHGWPGKPFQKRRPEKRRGHGSPTQVRVQHWLIDCLQANILVRNLFKMNVNLFLEDILSDLSPNLFLSVCLFFRVSLEDLYNGKTTKLQLSKNVLCSTCNG